MFGLPLNIKIAIAIALVAASAAAFGYYKWSQARIDALTAQIVLRDAQIEGYKAQVARLVSDAEATQRAQAELNERLASIRTEEARRATVDAERLGAAAVAKPSLIENRINRATRNTFRELEEITRRAQ